MSTTDYDVIAAEVHRKAIKNLTDEMAITLVRTSGSPIVTESKDFSTCLMDTKPEHLGFSSYVLFHVGSSLIGTQVIVDLVREEGGLRPGDGFVVNDPHTGGAMHQGDVSIIMPTFYGDEHLGWSFANMHVLDVGGVGISGYAPGAHDVWQEGMRFPPVRIIRDGAIDPQWEKYIAANVRAPGAVLNDIRSMISANNTATGKLTQIVDEFGLEAHRSTARSTRTSLSRCCANGSRCYRTASMRRSTGTSSTATTARTCCSSCAASSRSTAPTCGFTTRACRRSTRS